jgi:DNA-directed RNA polymerase subunit K/omega
MADYEDDTQENDYETGLDEIVAEEEIIQEQDNQHTQREVGKESRALKFLITHHPECRLDYIENVFEKLPLESYPPNRTTDKKHKSVPYLTLFEKTKIIGFRANQIAQGGRSYIHVPPHVTDVLDIARLELEQKRLPYILKRPMPDGSFEYIRLIDLIVI